MLRWTAALIFACWSFLSAIHVQAQQPADTGEKIAPPVLTTISWAPDGKRFVCIAEKAAGYEIHVANLRTNSLAPIVRSRDPLAAAAFSPDGVRIAYIRVPRNTDYLAEVRVVNSNGTDDRAITQGKNRAGLVIETSLCWHPSGSRVLFGTWCDVRSSDAFGLYIADIQGRETRRINPADEEAFHPRCSPDGSRIMYLGRTGGPAALVSIAPDASERNVIVHDIHRGSGLVSGSSAPAWAPDGNLFAFVEQRPGSDVTSVWISALQGRVPHEVSPQWQPAASPSWSGNSRYVSFQCGGSHTPASVWIGDASSLRAKPALDDKLFNVAPAYSPANDRIAVRTFYLKDAKTPEGSLVRIVSRRGKIRTLLDEDPLTIAAMRLRAVPGADTARKLYKQLKRRGHRTGVYKRWMLLAAYYEDTALFRDAAKSYGRAAAVVENKHDKFKAQYAQAKAWAQAGEDRKALDLYFDIAKEMSPAQRAEARAYIDGLEDVSKLKDKLLRGENPALMAQLATAYSRIGCRRQAVKWRCRLIESFPDYPEIEQPIKDLADDCARGVPLGTVSWRALFMAVKSLRNKNKPVPPNLLVFAAEAHVRRGSSDEAITNIIDAIEAGLPETLRDRTASILLDLGDLYLAKDDFPTAAECYKKAIDLSKTATAARGYQGLARAHYRTSNHAQAAQAFGLALDATTHPQTHELAAELIRLCNSRLPPTDLAAYKRALAKAYRISGMTAKAEELEKQ